MFYWSQNVYKKFSRSLEQFFSHRRTEQFWKQNTSTPPEYIFCFFLSVSMILKILLLLIRITTLEYTCFLQARQANVHTSYYMCRTVATANTFHIVFYLVRFVFFCGEIGQANCIKILLRNEPFTQRPVCECVHSVICT